jgi:hypothetical protein
MLPGRENARFDLLTWTTLEAGPLKPGHRWAEDGLLIGPGSRDSLFSRAVSPGLVLIAF